jgi:hypothetical protein
MDDKRAKIGYNNLQTGVISRNNTLLSTSILFSRQPFCGCVGKYRFLEGAYAE